MIGSILGDEKLSCIAVFMLILISSSLCPFFLTFYLFYCCFACVCVVQGLRLETALRCPFSFPTLQGLPGWNSGHQACLASDCTSSVISLSSFKVIFEAGYGSVGTTQYVVQADLEFTFILL